MTFFVPPEGEHLPCWKFRWLTPPGFVCPDRVWMRGDVKAGTLLKWATDMKRGHAMVPAEEHEAIAVATELYYAAPLDPNEAGEGGE